MPAAAAYVVAFFAILFSASSALTWIYIVRHVDPPVSDTERVGV
jgi:hypothetical protein